MSLEPTSRSGRVLLIVCVTVGGLVVALAGLSFVIHAMMLRTDRFNWLEAPKDKPADK